MAHGRSGHWECWLVDHPELIHELRDHVLKQDEVVVLRVRRPPRLSNLGRNYKVKTFGSRAVANRALDEKLDN